MPNTTIRAVREAMRLSQEEFAAKIQEAGAALGEPNECTARTVQRWETGSVSYPRRNMVRAIEKATGYAAEALGFDHVARGESFWDHTDVEPVQITPNALEEPAVLVPIMPTLAGIWESRCTYKSSSRGGEDRVDMAYLVAVHAGDSVTLRSIDGSVTDGGSLIMKLELRGRVASGTWEQVTGAKSYYRGAIFHGVIQMQIEASNARMAGAWAGFGRDFDVNTGPWSLRRVENDTRRADDYTHLPE
ncbi:helix-turn-helix domain-containing protein [Kribbella sp. NBC_01505]|uniref:helix-turn-helix domain-containing protein n=1 Tax=Kribbella sp. NBC_01505 TaxID=2903580 RepID=UPI00386F4FD8